MTTTVKEQYPRAINELSKLNSLPRSQVIADVTYDNVTPEIEEMIQALCEIKNMGRKTALEVLFMIGINWPNG